MSFVSLFQQLKSEAKPLTKEELKALQSSKPKKSLFDQLKEERNQNALTAHELVLRKWKFDKLTHKKKEYFKKVLSDTLQIAQERGIGLFQLESGEIGFEEHASQEGIYRTEDRTNAIEKLQILQDTYKDLLSTQKVDLSLPKFDEININTEIESPQRECHHILFDFETDKHQHPIALGAYNHETRKQVIWIRAKPEDSKIAIYPLTNDNEFLIFVHCPNPLEALFISDIENVYAQILLSALAEGQINLISILKEIQIKSIPIHYETLRKFLFHQLYSLYISHNSKFDVNALIGWNRKCRREGFVFILPRIAPQTIKINYGKTTYYQDGFVRQFSKSLGNTQAGFRFTLKHTTDYSWLGIPNISLYPVQEFSEPSSYAIDNMLLSIALQHTKPEDAPADIVGNHSLAAISYGTAYEKLSTEEQKDEEKIFKEEDFYLDEYLKPSPSLKYLIYDCFSTLSGYAQLTQKLPISRLYKVLELNSENYFQKPLVCKIISTASLAKHLLFKFLEQTTGLSQKQIETNIEAQRHYLKPFDYVEKIQLTEDNERLITKLRTFFGGRIEASIFGKVIPTNDETIEFSDFASQYPHHSRLICAIIQYIEAAQGILHKRIVQKQKAVENNLWNIVKQLIKDIDNGVITERPYATINGVIKVNTQYKLQIRRAITKKKKNDVLVKGEFIAPIADVIGAILRKYYVEKYTLQQLRKHIHVKNGLFLRFTPEEIAEHGKEYFTKLYVLRKQFPKTDSINLLLKIIMNTSYGISSEGITKEDYTGKLFIPSISNGITATARLSNTIAEIKLIENNGTPLITHTDSVVALAKPKIHEKVNTLFSQIDPLVIETEKPIKWIAILGKAKYGLKTTDNKLKILTHGSGSYGKVKVKASYEKMFDLIYEENLSVTEAAQIAKNLFPLFHQVDIKDNFSYTDKRKQNSTTKKLKEILALGDVIREIEYKKATIYIIETKKKLKRTKKIVNIDKKTNTRTEKVVPTYKRQYLITTTDEILKGMFCDFASFNKGMVRIANFTPLNTEELCNFILTIPDLPETIPKIIKHNLIQRPSALEHLQKRFWFDQTKYGRRPIPKLTQLTEKLLAKRSNVYALNFKPSEIVKYEGLISSLQFFETTLPTLEADGSMIKVIDDDFWNYDDSFTKRQWDKIKRLLHITSPFKCEPDELAEELAELGYFDMMQILLAVDDPKFQRYLEERMRYEKNPKQELFFNVRKSQRLRKKIERPYTTHIFRKTSKNGYIQMQVMDYPGEESVPDIPLIQDEKTYESDGFTLSGFVKLPNLNFTEYLIGNRNQAYTDCLLNTARTVSVKYAKKKYANNPEKLEEIANKYLYQSKYEELPFPKLGKTVHIYSQIIPIPHQLTDKQIIEENIPFLCEKWVLDVIYDRSQLNDLIRDGKLEPVDQSTIKILNPKHFKKVYEKYATKSELTFQFIGYEWLFLLKPYNSLDCNSYLHLGIVVGKNRTINYKFHLNPTSNRLINFNTMRINIPRLQEEGIFIRDIMANLFQTDFLTDFKQNRSLNLTDIEEKSDSPELLRTIYEIIAQVIIETKFKYSRIKLSEVHLTTDLKAEKHILKQALGIAEEIMQQAYEEKATHGLASKEGKRDKTELRFRRNFKFSRARSTEGSYFQNFLVGRSSILYPKGYRQIASKYVRRTFKKDVDPNILRYAKLNANESVIRVETQLRGFNTIQDSYEINTHQFFITWMKSILHYLEKNEKFVHQYFRLRKEIIQQNKTPFVDFLNTDSKRAGFRETQANPEPPD